MNASCAAFYDSLSSANGLDDLFATMRRRMKQDRYADFLLKSVSFTKEDNVRATVFGTMPNDTFDVTLQLNVTYKVPDNDK